MPPRDADITLRDAGDHTEAEISDDLQARLVAFRRRTWGERFLCTTCARIFPRIEEAAVETCGKCAAARRLGPAEKGAEKRAETDP